MTHNKHLSKFISLVLRHEPDKFGITLDEHGFTPLSDLWDVIQRNQRGLVTYEDMLYVLTQPAEDGKQRFEVVGEQVRARYGHNQRVTPIEYAPMTPPAVLYHGTATDALTAIRTDGLLPRARQYVHMATTTTRAVSVGSRHGTPVLLTIRAAEAHAAGVLFYQADDEHYLAVSIPAAFIVFPAE